jgi:hypothetical protein
MRKVKTVQTKTPDFEFWWEAQTDEKSPKISNKWFLQRPLLQLSFDD